MSSLFIGLGGVGTEVLDSLNKKMIIFNKSLKDQGKNEVTADYYYIDTENKRYSEHPGEFTPSNKKYFLQIGTKSPDSIYDGFKTSADTNSDVKELFDLLTKWYDAPSKTTTMLDGADTIRQYSRLAFCEATNASANYNFYNQLKTLIENVDRSGGRIYVITGSCGGTGCGIYLDVLYMIAEIYAGLHNDTDTTNVRLIMSMPEGYIGTGMTPQQEKTKLNAFATLEELNAICKDKNNQSQYFRNCYIGNKKKETGVFQPFRHGYLFESAEKTRDQVAQELSDFLFELELAGDPNSNDGSALIGYNGSDFDGIITGTVDQNWNATVGNPYVKAFNALGQYSIERPDELYRMYFKDRLLFDVFHKGLVGSPERVDEAQKDSIAIAFLGDCDEEAGNTKKTILRAISLDDFKDKNSLDITFSIFTSHPANGEKTVDKVIEAKNKLLKNIEKLTYAKCKEWLRKYDFSTVYKILEKADVDSYAIALNHSDNNTIEDTLKTAKDTSKSNVWQKIWQKGDIDAAEAKKQFENLVGIWLSFEMNKALSSGVGVDITENDKGYLDKCKSFVETAKKGLTLDEKQEHWDERFIKHVTDLKCKDDRSYIPDLTDFVNADNKIPEDDNCRMWIIYRNSFVENISDNSIEGKMSPAGIHQKIINTMIDGMNNGGIGIDMENLFDPTPGIGGSLRKGDTVTLFVNKYVKFAEEVIGNLLEANTEYKSLFATSIIDLLHDSPRRATICTTFHNYRRSQLKSENIVESTLTNCYYYILGSVSDTQLMQDLGILDQNGHKMLNSAHSCSNGPNSFFDDKIVKLIVRNGYSVDNYRHFDTYKNNAKQKLIKTDGKKLAHDPFIDNRFLGEPDADGKYPCNVSDALKTIAENKQAVQQAQQFSLDGCNDVQVYQFCLALLAKYYETLQTNNYIENDLKNAITISNHSITIKSLKFNKFLQTYKLDSQVPDPIDLGSIKDTNSMLDLQIWIDFVSKKKDLIRNEKVLYDAAYSMLLDFVDIEGTPLETVVMSMRGTGNKPVYDFFNAYLVWYNKKN